MEVQRGREIFLSMIWTLVTTGHLGRLRGHLGNNMCLYQIKDSR